MKEFYSRLIELLGEHRRVALATVVKSEGSTPREPGAKMIVLPDKTTHGTVGGGALENRVIDEALQALKEGCGFLRQYDLKARKGGGIGAICGGRATVLVEILSAGERLLICGGGHIGLELARMGAAMGFRVAVADPRKDFSDAGRFPEGVDVLRARPSGRKVLGLVDADTYIVILTHSHSLDKEALKALAPRGARYVGMIGSRAKVARILAELKNEGMDGRVLSRVHAPIGLDIGAETPAEIAVAILAEMVNIRRRGESSPISMKGKSAPGARGRRLSHG